MEPKCPLCGARSSWRGKDNTELWRKRIPDQCHFCKEEKDVHWQQFYEGPDVTQFGGQFLHEFGQRRDPSWSRLKRKIGGKDAEN